MPPRRPSPTSREFFIRTSYTLWQVTVPLAQWAAKQNIKKVVTAVTDYGPGIDAETAFKSEFTKQGGTVVESIRMPISTTDFAPFVQRIKASGAQAVYTFLPGGPPNLGFVKAYNENGLAKAGIQFLGTAETDEFDLQKFGDAALGLTTAFHYSAAHDSPANKTVRRGAQEARPERHRQLRVGRRLGRHVRDPQDDRGDRRQEGRPQGDRRGPNAAMGEPARPGPHRPEDPPHRAERLPAQGREGRAASWSTRNCRTSARRATTGWTSKLRRQSADAARPAMQTLANILIDGLAYGMVLFIIAVGLSVTLGPDALREPEPWRLRDDRRLRRGAADPRGAVELLARLPAAVLATAAARRRCSRRWCCATCTARSELEQVLFTIGLAFFLIAATNALAGPQVQLIVLPPLLAQSVDLGFRTLPAQRLLVIAAGLVVAAAAAWTVARTRFGIWLRAAVDHPDAASTLGHPDPHCAVRQLRRRRGAGWPGRRAGRRADAAGAVLRAEVPGAGAGGRRGRRHGQPAGRCWRPCRWASIETASKYLASDWGSLFFFLAMAAAAGLASADNSALLSSSLRGRTGSWLAYPP